MYNPLVGNPIALITETVDKLKIKIDCDATPTSACYVNALVAGNAEKRTVCVQTGDTTVVKTQFFACIPLF